MGRGGAVQGKRRGGVNILGTRAPSLRGSRAAREESWVGSGAPPSASYSWLGVNFPLEAGFGAAEHVLRGWSPEYTLRKGRPLERPGKSSPRGRALLNTRHGRAPPQRCRAGGKGGPAGSSGKRPPVTRRRALRRILGVVVH